ncbi:MAG: hypothetical protein IJ055_01280 [Oscillospiraceae bacterium]|nr:hypothetical protein [Oscillospiraceae bacterium]
MSEQFRYTYSAKRHAEVETIRQKYTETPPAEDKLTQLRRLDRSCEFPGTVAGCAVGVAGTLLLGAGFALLLKTSLFAVGIVIGIAGLGIMAAALPVYRSITRARRRQLTPEILRLSEEIERGE